MNRADGIPNMTSKFPQYTYYLLEDATWGSSIQAMDEAFAEIGDLSVELLIASSFFDMLYAWQGSVEP